MSGRLHITSHAVQRYRERWAPHLTPSEARAELRSIAAGARPEKQGMLDGKERWVADADERIVFVVKRDAHTRERICLTILPQQASVLTDIYDEVQALLKENEEDWASFRASNPETPAKTEPLSYQCDKCHELPAVRYSRKFRERWCTSCYQSMRRTDLELGRCPTLEDYDTSVVAEKGKKLQHVTDILARARSSLSKP